VDPASGRPPATGAGGGWIRVRVLVLIFFFFSIFYFLVRAAYAKIDFRRCFVLDGRNNRTRNEFRPYGKIVSVVVVASAKASTRRVPLRLPPGHGHRALW
jgi:hypothetical protein